MTDNKNNPLLKLKEKKEQIHTPIITSPFNTSDPKTININPTDAAVIEERSTNEARQINIDTEKPKKTKPQQPKSNNIKYNLIIDSDALFTLKALSNYFNEPINKTLNKALQKYFDFIGEEETQKAKNIYTQILKLKGAYYGEENNR